MRSEEIKKKVKNTCLNKYGINNPMQSKEIQKKSITTTLKHWGVEYSLSSEKVREKMEQTNLLRYGFKNPAQSKEIQEKIRKTFFENGKVRTSTQQIKLFNTLLEKYENCILNFPLENYSLDCVLEIEDVKIDVEYDGWYWHTINNMKEKDRIRDQIVINNGYKILRIKGGRILPEKEELFKSIEELKNTNLFYKEIFLPEWEENVVEDC